MRGDDLLEGDSRQQQREAHRHPVCKVFRRHEQYSERRADEQEVDHGDVAVGRCGLHGDFEVVTTRGTAVEHLVTCKTGRDCPNMKGTRNGSVFNTAMGACGCHGRPLAAGAMRNGASTVVHM